ncbi:transcription termination/antitermination protein NusG [Pontibacter akesuensis]|uniref:Transcription antitermination factor NusG n=1 Tax=Pontibacter akesuensis TaxID=388950 RepID=A0A1I7J1Z3_9BACT|nr:UpxY family transcription antiterminator [Pontibacter akesuensis]GHA72911.1 hypothetical protein GCM10007389_28450 [Pontibacter akesuensis]SFU79167.1 Transcription antitermination factor NusG [Pontibacter akesuensis]
MDERWYAVYTKPRWEKKVADALTQINVTNYCPLNKVMRQWSDRRKLIQAPLLPSYVFVRLQEKQFPHLRQVPGIINLVHWLGKPAVIRDEEIEAISQFLKEHSTVKVQRAAFNVNDKVKVTSGSLMDKEGTVVAVKNNQIKVALPSLGFFMYAELDTASAVKV